jgi:hypothetical protein
MGNGPYVFKMGGSVYHPIGSLMPVDTEAPKFAQLYIVDSGDELNCGLNIFEEEGGSPSHANPFVVLALTDMLDEYYHYVGMVVVSTRIQEMSHVSASVHASRQVQE